MESSTIIDSGLGKGGVPVESGRMIFFSDPFPNVPATVQVMQWCVRNYKSSVQPITCQYQKGHMQTCQLSRFARETPGLAHIPQVPRFCFEFSRLAAYLRIKIWK